MGGVTEADVGFPTDGRNVSYAIENRQHRDTYVQCVAKSIGACKKTYTINKNHIFSTNYCEVISG